MKTTFMSFTHKCTRLIQLLLVFTTFLIKKTHAVEGCKPQTAGTPGFEMSRVYAWLNPYFKILISDRQ